MKKNKTEQHKGKLTPNAMLNEVGGAVKERKKRQKLGTCIYCRDRKLIFKDGLCDSCYSDTNEDYHKLKFGE